MRRTSGLFGLALLGFTWRLWTPQHVFPQVPLVRWGLALDSALQWLLAAAMAAGLLLALLATSHAQLARWGLLTFAVAAAMLALADQQRLQPWAYELTLIAVILAWARAPSAVGWLRLLVVSFYFYSALSKFDVSFLHTLGQQFLATLVAVFGGSIESWSPPSRQVAAAIFPIAELAVAIGLCWMRTRRLAVVAAVVLHGLLLVILGPWGLDHRPAVLIWNVLFAVQDVVLFWPRRTMGAGERPEAPAPRAMTATERIAQTIAMASIGLPLLAPTSWFDIWPSWGLYAACAERSVLLVHRQAIEELPEALRAYCTGDEDPSDPWLVLRLDRLALDMLSAPIYPQNRSQIGVAMAVIERYQLTGRARVVRFGLADRWNGTRESSVLAGLPQILAAGDEYFFNSRPRAGFFGFEVGSDSVSDDR